MYLRKQFKAIRDRLTHAHTKLWTDLMHYLYRPAVLYLERIVIAYGTRITACARHNLHRHGTIARWSNYLCFRISFGDSVKHTTSIQIWLVSSVVVPDVHCWEMHTAWFPAGRLLEQLTHPFWRNGIQLGYLRVRQGQGRMSDYIFTKNSRNHLHMTSYSRR